VGSLGSALPSQTREATRATAPVLVAANSPRKCSTNGANTTRAMLTRNTMLHSDPNRRVRRRSVIARFDTSERYANPHGQSFESK
jgi:hypothetical protein